jgi:hypothetical protein
VDPKDIISQLTGMISELHASGEHAALQIEVARLQGFAAAIALLNNAPVRRAPRAPRTPGSNGTGRRGRPRRNSRPEADLPIGHQLMVESGD